MTVVISLDQSTTCTGVTIGYIDKSRLIRLETRPIVTSDDDVPELCGYLPGRRRTKTKKGETILSFVKYIGEPITKTEKKNREREVRNAAQSNRLKFITKELAKIITSTQPSFILMEKNMSFGGILTTKKLAEVAGTIHALAAVYDTKLIEYNVHEVRAPHKITELVQEFASKYTARQLKMMGDVTKSALRYKMLEKYRGYKLNPRMTLDESDSLVIFDFWCVQNNIKLHN